MSKRPGAAGRWSPTVALSVIFYPNEVYTDVDAFDAHASGPYFGAFFAEASTHAEGPTWLPRETSSVKVTSRTVSAFWGAE
jgi:hypothetical protein